MCVKSNVEISTGDNRIVVYRQNETIRMDVRLKFDTSGTL